MSNERLEVNRTPTVFYIKLPDGSKAYLRYEVVGKTLRLIETYTPPQHRGKGLAGLMVEEAIKYAVENDLKIEPICSYVVHYFVKNREKRGLLLDRYRNMSDEELAAYYGLRREEEGKKQR